MLLYEGPGLYMVQSISTETPVIVKADDPVTTKVTLIDIQKLQVSHKHGGLPVILFSTLLH